MIITAIVLIISIFIKSCASVPIVHCPPFLAHMPRYLGVRSKIQKGRCIWAARAYGTELGCALADDKAAEIVQKMGEVASIRSLVIPSSVLSPKSVARYEGVCYRKTWEKPRGMVGGQEALLQGFWHYNCSRLPHAGCHPGEVAEKGCTE